jgi:5-methylcytosine-specific restriction protein A
MTDRRSAQARLYRAWYKSKRWQRLRQHQLAKHPYCQCPHHEGKKLLADVVDHKTPHKGNERLFFDDRNLQSMTKQCHDSHKQSMERGGHGFERGCDEKGYPLVPIPGWSTT